MTRLFCQLQNALGSLSFGSTRCFNVLNFEVLSVCQDSTSKRHFETGDVLTCILPHSFGSSEHLERTFGNSVSSSRAFFRFTGLAAAEGAWCDLVARGRQEWRSGESIGFKLRKTRFSRDQRSGGCSEGLC